MRAGPVAGPAEAVRHDHAEAVGEARHQAGRVLDHGDRRVEPDAVLPAGLGVAGRARTEMGPLRVRPGLAGGAGTDRGERCDRREGYQRGSGTDVVLVGEVAKRARVHLSRSAGEVGSRSEPGEGSGPWHSALRAATSPRSAGEV